MPRMCLFTKHQYNMSLSGTYVVEGNIQIYVKQTTDRPNVIIGIIAINNCIDILYA